MHPFVAPLLPFLRAGLEVRLISHTPDPEGLVVAAARQTRSAKAASDLLAETREQPRTDLIEKLIDMSHLSPLEHASFTFYIGGISRACSHQLVRHRLASYSQQSQRTVKIERCSFVTLPTVAARPEARALFEEAVSRSIEAYDTLLSLGVPKEDARYVVPQAVETKIVVTMNARELLHFFGLRLCERAQWEIRELAKRMLEEVKRVAPSIFSRAGPRCMRLGKCSEGDEKCFSEAKRKWGA